jgi:hypothetical protein
MRHGKMRETTKAVTQRKSTDLSNTQTTQSPIIAIIRTKSEMFLLWVNCKSTFLTDRFFQFRKMEMGSSKISRYHKMAIFCNNNIMLIDFYFRAKISILRGWRCRAEAMATAETIRSTPSVAEHNLSNLHQNKRAWRKSGKWNENLVRK